MKKLLLTLICIFAVTSLLAQKIEFSLQANSGLFRYAGKSAVSRSLMHQSPPQVPNFTENPYGNKSGLGYDGILQAQVVCKGGFIAGLQAGYELLKSKVDINQIWLYTSFQNDYNTTTFVGPTPNGANGKTYLKNEFINISPYIGYRIDLKKIKIDLMPGIEWGFGLSTHESGKATTTDGNNTTVQTSIQRDKAPTDMRLKFGAALIYNRFGLTSSYAHGVTKYQPNLVGFTDLEVHSELMRFGLSYRLL